MDGCKQIKVLIDEAERPEAIAYAASQHIASCNDCGQFLDERAKLKALLADVGRVSAPTDFDFKLKARLAEVKGRKNSWWLTPSGYLRLGGATAALVIAVVAAQTGGLFSADKTAGPVLSESTQSQPINPPTMAVVSPPVITKEVVEPDYKVPAAGLVGSRNNRRQVRTTPAAVSGYIAEDGTMVLMRGPAGEHEVPVPTVSVGAQSLMYVNSGRQTARAVSTSF
ncbi:MAG TPA: hypothetical protein VF131_19740 [Blastocatellia bacterium]|nr:hypothetical protein [Blastocatellia bacterium]